LLKRQTGDGVRFLNTDKGVSDDFCQTAAQKKKKRDSTKYRSVNYVTNKTHTEFTPFSSFGGGRRVKAQLKTENKRKKNVVHGRRKWVKMG